MKKLIFLFLVSFPLIIKAQDKSVPVQSITTNLERIEIIRMKPGTDMLEGLNSFVKEKKIKNAVIIAGVGSVTDYRYHVVSDKNLPPAQEFPKASVAMDLTSVQGFILSGKVHAHITLSDANSMVGGHLEAGTKALTFFILTIGILPDKLDLVNFDTYKY